MSSNAASKRPLGDAEEAPAVKRGRGRPRKDGSTPAASSAPAPKDPNAPPKARGRPRKNTNAGTAQPENVDAPKRGRGRPRKDPNAQPQQPKDGETPKRGRGRPRKDPNALAPLPTPKSPKVPGRGRGRPRKDATAMMTKNGPDRPKKAEATLDGTTNGSTISNKGAAQTKADETGFELASLIGTYDIDCPTVKEEWPEKVDDMFLAIFPLSQTPSALIASFNLGILEGTMLIASDRETLGNVRTEMENGGIKTKGKASDTVISGRSVYFTWRGRNCGDDDEVHTGFNGAQTGIIKLTNDEFTFRAVGSFPGLGQECRFRGTRLDEALAHPDHPPEPWESFSEEAREEANRAAGGESRG